MMMSQVACLGMRSSSCARPSHCRMTATEASVVFSNTHRLIHRSSIASRSHRQRRTSATAHMPLLCASCARCSHCPANIAASQCMNERDRERVQCYLDRSALHQSAPFSTVFCACEFTRRARTHHARQCTVSTRRCYGRPYRRTICI